jgi:adenosylcobinamide kinase / adenosylcobinamide-phosphate guanylyltransferase
LETTRRGRVTLVLGGVRSGKSRYALQLAERVDGPRLFVATATVSDEEMAAKIERHRQDRGAEWETIEESVRLGAVVRDAACEVMIVDCLTMFAARLLDGNEDEVDALCGALGEARCDVIVVSNEVGSGVVPAYESGRRFRDLLGEINQKVAGIADVVVLMVAGLPLVLKGVPA